MQEACDERNRYQCENPTPFHTKQSLSTGFCQYLPLPVGHMKLRLIIHLWSFDLTLQETLQYQARGNGIDHGFTLTVPFTCYLQ